VAFEPQRLTIAYGGEVVCRDGVAVAHDPDAVAAHLAQRNVEVTADLGLGSGEWLILTNDLSPAYIDENKGTS
jgi:N-acetylglutamate synthase/N-acetylornithine aminotransferase